MTDGWAMDAIEEAGWNCPEPGCIESFGHDLDPQHPHRYSPEGRQDSHPVPLIALSARDELDYAEWLAQLPVKVREPTEELFPTSRLFNTCWRLASADGHYVIKSIGEHEHEPPASVNVRHITGPGSRLFEGVVGVVVYGVSFDELRLCGCGRRQE